MTLSHLNAAVGLDVRLQARNSLYAIGVVVALVFGIAVRFLVPVDVTGRVLSAFYLVAVGGTTYMFGASMVLLEKGERTMEALRTSPLTAREYIASKALTLSAFALVEAAIVVVVAGRGAIESPVPLLVGVLVLGVSYTLLGIGQATPYQSVTTFLFPGAVVVSLVLQLPIFHVAGMGPTLLWYVIPTQAPLLLIMGGFEPLDPWQWFYATSVSVAAVWASYVFARARFRTHIGFLER